jgi:hypothetical protein
MPEVTPLGQPAAPKAAESVTHVLAHLLSMCPVHTPVKRTSIAEADGEMACRPRSKVRSIGEDCDDRAVVTAAEVYGNPLHFRLADGVNHQALAKAVLPIQ